MPKNHLLEAAAEVLKASQAAGHADPPQKLAGSESEDLGGPTPDKTQDTKIDYTKPISKVTPPGKPAPIGQMPPQKVEKSLEELAEGENITINVDADDDDKDDKKDKKDKKDKGDKKDKDEDDDKDKKDDKEDDDKDEKKENPFKNLKEQVAADFKKSLAEDVAAILKEEDGLSPEFKQKVATIYEARILHKIDQLEEQMINAYDEVFSAEVLAFQEAANEKINDYLDYVVEEWMNENEVAIEKGLKTELTEDFLTGLHNLFTEHYISVPEDKVDVVEELAGKIEELETSLNEEIQRGIELKKQLTESKKDEVLRQVCEGLTQTQVEKVRSLAESVEFTAEGDYAGKLKTIRENFFGKDVKKPSEESTKVLTEATEDPQPEPKKASSDPLIQAYVSTLKKTLPN